jgi:hypothetical protein
MTGFGYPLGYPLQTIPSLVIPPRLYNDLRSVAGLLDPPTTYRFVPPSEYLRRHSARLSPRPALTGRQRVGVGEILTPNVLWDDE